MLKPIGPLTASYHDVDSPDAASLLDRYIRSHNEGVRSGSFSSMLTLFDDGAEVCFDGISYGPLRGKAAIGEAFAQHPPSDELIPIGTACSEETQATVRYGWRSDGGAPAGRLRLTASQGRICALTISVRSS